MRGEKESAATTRIRHVQPGANTLDEASDRNDTILTLDATGPVR